MEKLKLMIIVGTRPELIRLSEILKSADVYFDTIFVHTGQNYDERLNDIFYDDLGIRKPDYYLDVVGEDLGVTLGNVISKSYELMNRVKPDALLVLGDTNSALSVISAKRLKIPIFHMEAGNRCFDENLPEEINRRIIDHVSDLHMPYTEHARRYLLAEGIRKEFIYVTGSPMREVLKAHRKEIDNSNILQKMKLEANKYILLSAHREENIDNLDNFINLTNAINKMAEKYQIPIIYSMHPRSERYITERKISFHPLIQKLRPFSFTDYNKLQENALCVVSDSGTMPEESAISGFTGVCIRTSTERPESLEKGCFVIAGIQEKTLIQAVDMAINMSKNRKKTEIVTDYQTDNVSDIVIKLIQSYTDIINRNIWRKK